MLNKKKTHKQFMIKFEIRENLTKAHQFRAAAGQYNFPHETKA